MKQEIVQHAVTALVKRSKLPDAVSSVIDLEGWAWSVLDRRDYNEPDPEFVSRMLAFQTITADTIEEIFRQAQIKQLQKLVADTPGASTGPLELDDLYVAKSDFETGNPTYVIASVHRLDEDYEYKFTTGATNVQATFIALLAHGVWPIRFQVVRGDSKDKGGRYLFFVTPPD